MIQKPRRKPDPIPNGHVWRDGDSEWLPISQVAELTGSGSAPVSPPPPISGRAAHEIDFQIFGEEMQFVEIELDPGESAVAEAGTMMYKDTSIQMHTIFGDGSAQADPRVVSWTNCWERANGC